jgi:hypothetical protein
MSETASSVNNPFVASSPFQPPKKYACHAHTSEPGAPSERSGGPSELARSPSELRGGAALRGSSPREHKPCGARAHVTVRCGGGSVRWRFGAVSGSVR